MYLLFIIYIIGAAVTMGVMAALWDGTDWSFENTPTAFFCGLGWPFFLVGYGAFVLTKKIFPVKPLKNGKKSPN